MRISCLPCRSGGPTRSIRSNLPDLSSAGSSISGRLVAAITTTSFKASRPSSSARSWFTTLSITLPPSSIPLIGAMESSSSKNMIAGETCLALRNISLIAFSDSPTHLESICGPRMLMKLALVSLATA